MTVARSHVSIVVGPVPPSSRRRWKSSGRRRLFSYDRLHLPTSVLNRENAFTEKFFATCRERETALRLAPPLQTPVRQAAPERFGIETNLGKHAKKAAIANKLRISRTPRCEIPRAMALESPPTHEPGRRFRALRLT